MGFFGMKAEGAALATVIAQTISVAISLCASKKLNTGLSLKLIYFKPDVNIFKNLLKIGVPVSAQTIRCACHLPDGA